MTKYAIFVLVSIFVIACQGYPAPQNNDIATAAAAGNWEQVHQLLEKMYEKMFNFKKLDLIDSSEFDGVLKSSVKDLKPIKGGKVYGESEVTFMSANVDETGQKHVASGGHKVVNDNGKVEEYDFTPKI